MYAERFIHFAELHTNHDGRRCSDKVNLDVDFFVVLIDIRIRAVLTHDDDLVFARSCIWRRLHCD